MKEIELNLEEFDLIMNALVELTSACTLSIAREQEDLAHYRVDGDPYELTEITQDYIKRREHQLGLAFSLLERFKPEIAETARALSGMAPRLAQVMERKGGVGVN